MNCSAVFPPPALLHSCQAVLPKLVHNAYDIFHYQIDTLLACCRISFILTMRMHSSGARGDSRVDPVALTLEAPTFHRSDKHQLLASQFAVRSEVYMNADAQSDVESRLHRAVRSGDAPGSVRSVLLRPHSRLPLRRIGGRLTIFYI